MQRIHLQKITRVLKWYQSHSPNQSQSQRFSPLTNFTNGQVESEGESSSSDDDDDNIDPAQVARILAKNRSPRKAEQWAKTHLTPEKSQPQRRKSSQPLFIPSASESEDEVQEQESPYQVMLRMTGQAPEIKSGSQTRKSKTRREFSSDNGPTIQERRKSFILEKRKSLGVEKKKSIFDEQSDARKISFDSRKHTPQHSNTPPTRKRQRSHSNDSDSDEFQDYNPPPNADRLERSRVSASSRRPPPPDPVEIILNRIHGPESPRNTVYGSGGGGGTRKGRGFEWTERQEKFLIHQIEVYGPAWADIARAYCKPGEILEGRDQTKLKDKARNIKEKYIRYLPTLRHTNVQDCVF